MIPGLVLRLVRERVAEVPPTEEAIAAAAAAKEAADALIAKGCCFGASYDAFPLSET